MSKMKLYSHIKSIIWLLLIINWGGVVISESYYSVIAPGNLKENRNYNVLVSLLESREPAAITITLEGPSLQVNQVAYLQPSESVNVTFEIPKLVDGEYKLIAEGKSGIEFRNETILFKEELSGPKIYIQTDKSVYKPGDEVKFRFVILDEHTRPLKIREPVHVEILDGKGNRVKQFKDIKLVQGIYKNKFQLSEYTVIGDWQIRVSISGRYDFSKSKRITVQHYVLPKFSVFIEVDENFISEDRVIKALVYGKYTFDRYVEGNVTAKLEDIEGTVIQQKHLTVKDQLSLEFYFDNTDDFKTSGLRLTVEITEKFTGIKHSEQADISVQHQRYSIDVDIDSIQYQGSRPYRLKAKVQHWNGRSVEDRTEPVIMTHGSKNYTAYLDSSDEAIFEFDHNKSADHDFLFQDSTYNLPNTVVLYNEVHDSYCKLMIKGDRPRLGIPVEIVMTSIADIPYLVYALVSHGNIIRKEHITLPPNRKSYTIQEIPSIEMVPSAFVYVYYVVNGNYHYGEIELNLPLEFENKVTVMAPKEANPGEDVKLELKAQPKSYVGVMAVDLGVYLLKPNFDLEKSEILEDLNNDISRIQDIEYPGFLSGLVTLTNAHFEVFVPETESLPANSYGGGGDEFKLRNKFPETWIFENFEITENITTLNLHIPDSITTWRITAFSVNEVTGFGIVDGPTDITTIQSFFINLNLPYSVKRGEIVSIPVLIHNYHDRDLDTEVVMYNQDQEFYFMESSDLNGERGSDDQERVKRIKVPANGVEYAMFLINPIEVGDIKLQIVATNSISSDRIIRKLKVEPEGTRKIHTKSMYLSVKAGEDIKVTLPVNIPPKSVPNSEFVTLNVDGNNLAPTIKNLNSLVSLPTGGCEQSMVNFAPNVLVLQYLNASGKYQTERDLVAKAERFIELGYQQQLSYRHANGGYSDDGPQKDKEPSTWLTAYVIRFFIKGSKYFDIGSNIIDSGLKYLAKNQEDDGHFNFTGYLHYPARQNRYGFTAFVLMTFLEDKKYMKKYESYIEKGLEFLNKKLDNIKDVYALSIAAAVLQMAKHHNAHKFIDKLVSSKNITKDLVWFSQNDKNLEKDVEITGYALMALLENNGNSLYDQNIVNWLTQQRNERGGFKSTHDTVVALQALVKFTEKYNDMDQLNLKIQYKAKDNESQVLKSGEMEVDKNNLLILQNEEFPKSTSSIEVKATGFGHSMLQLSYHYHVLTDSNFEHFDIQPQPKMLNTNEMQLAICFTYKNSEGEINSTNMIIMEANLPSGFTTSDEFNTELLDNEVVERLESKNGETTLVIYLKELSANVKHCLNILSSRIHEVAKHKPAAIVVYDYYNISRHDTVFYNV